MLKIFYSRFVLKKPFVVLFIVLVSVFFLGFHATKLEIDASSSTLLLENDKDLQFARQVNKNYANPSFLILTYTPKEDLLSDNTLNEIKILTSELEKLEQITSTTSILNVPLLQSPVIPINELVKDVKHYNLKMLINNLSKMNF